MSFAFPFYGKYWLQVKRGKIWLIMRYLKSGFDIIVDRMKAVTVTLLLVISHITSKWNITCWEHCCSSWDTLASRVSCFSFNLLIFSSARLFIDIITPLNWETLNIYKWPHKCCRNIKKSEVPFVAIAVHNHNLCVQWHDTIHSAYLFNLLTAFRNRTQDMTILMRFHMKYLDPGWPAILFAERR